MASENISVTVESVTVAVTQNAPSISLNTNARGVAGPTGATGPAGADGSDATVTTAAVDAAGAVMESDYDANTVLAATADNTPLALTVGEATIVGRAAGGNIAALTATQVRTIINVEDGATADQTGAEIKAAYEAEADTNAFTDAEKSKLSGIEPGADVTDAANVNAVESDPIVGAVNGIVKANGAGVISAAVADTDYQSVLSEGAFANGDKTKLDGIETGATADQSNAEIETAYNAQVAAASQGEAEAGTESAIRRFSPLRVFQAIAAFMGLSGAGAPSSTPKFINQPYYDTTNGDWYVAKGTSSSSDWVFKIGRTYTSGEVSGGAVQTVSTGTIPALIDGAEYIFSAKIVAAGTSILRLFVNGDTTTTNYRRGFISSNGTAGDTSVSPSAAVNAIGDVVSITGRIRVVESRVHMEAVALNYASSGRNLSQTAYHTSATSVTSLQVTSDTANHIDNGSEIWLRRVK